MQPVHSGQPSRQSMSKCCQAACLTTKLIALHAHATGHSCHSRLISPCRALPRLASLQQVAGQDACVPYQVSVSTCCNLRRTVAPTVANKQKPVATLCDKLPHSITRLKLIVTRNIVYCTLRNRFVLLCLSTHIHVHLSHCAATATVVVVISLLHLPL